jgi:N-acetylglucosamine-6-phosphate deacetylase
MASGYFDLQVNGCQGVDFQSDDLTADQLHMVCEKLAGQGVDGILATLTSDHIDKLVARLERIVRFRSADAVVAKMIAGFHIEGPFINETVGYRGAHPQDAIHPANEYEMNQLLTAAAGLAKIVTLAPERDSGMKVTRMLVKAGVRVAAGHCNVSIDDLRVGIDAGVTMFTHLGNGCPMLMDRHDNIIQRVLSFSDKLYLGFIADGAHVPFFALGNYLRCAGLSRCVIVTDCMSAAGMAPGHYTLGQWNVLVGPDMVARAPDGSHLVGSAITMPQTHKNLVEKLGLSGHDAMTLLSTNPRKAIGIL